MKYALLYAHAHKKSLFLFSFSFLHFTLAQFSNLQRLPLTDESMCPMLLLFRDGLCTSCLPVLLENNNLGTCFAYLY